MLNYNNLKSKKAIREFKGIQAGLKEIEEKTRVDGKRIIRFARLLNTNNLPNSYITVVRGSGCSSRIGRDTAGSQRLSIGNGCASRGIVAHEFMHSLGTMDYFFYFLLIFFNHFYILKVGSTNSLVPIEITL